MKEKIKTAALKTGNSLGASITDLSLLFKFRLTTTVVLSSFLAYLIAAGGTMNGWIVINLVLGGFFITFAANALNEILEKDFDRLMKRTSGRPLPRESMTVSKAVLIAGICALLGTIFLGLIGPLVAFLGMISLVLYAFIYTPMKRYSPAAVMVGAVPGALPAAIGAIAAEGRIGPLAIILFAIQFFWQFPHFWAIAWLADKDYKKAGFQLLPSSDGEKNAQTGMQVFIYCLLLLLTCLPMYFMGFSRLPALILVIVVTGLFTWFGWQFYRACTDASAKKVMFFSFAYLPLVFLIFYLDQII